MLINHWDLAKMFQELDLTNVMQKLAERLGIIVDFARHSTPVVL